MKPHAQPLIIGDSQATLFLRELIKTLAASSSTALITGESGTGKELVAQSLHMQGPRASGPFVPINCGAIPRDLIESELFGHRKGSFTGAVSDRLGRFELAHGGTLFLDEIGDLPMDMQVKLLRVLQERCILPVGASKEVPLDVRVVAATHKKLESEVESGRFREDLYYRINVLPVTTTPLRERPSDVVTLLHFYADKHALPHVRAVRFSPEMLQLMQSYAWPGNVRELSNLVDRFNTLFSGQLLTLATVPSSLLPKGLRVLQAERVTTPLIDSLEIVAPISNHDLHQSANAEVMNPFANPAPPLAMDMHNEVQDIIMLAQGLPSLPPEGLSLKDRLADIERDLILQALNRTDGNVSQTARLLNLQRTTLIEKLNKYDLRQGTLPVLNSEPDKAA